ncbi:MAG: hypothetical protein A3B65_04590 [Acidobacteria bacterium RIFCSPHIGHO2_02_FULL_67_57]|nr:MAG: hypothetical protein A3B65_04590 [Acidobacteria bacterium RIFCSPHIGHO2_02_FULL_67_57]
MKRIFPGLLILALAVALAPRLAAQTAPAAKADRWLHVKVEDAKKGETVRVNVPLRVAEAILPAINVDVIKNGRLRMEEIHTHGVDLRAVLEAVRTLEDGEFVTVESQEETVRVSKEGRFLLARIHERGDQGEQVAVKVPLALIDALLSGEKDELNIAAAIRALNELGDEVYIAVTSPHETVRVWVDSKKAME